MAMKRFEQYTHHEALVWVQSDLKGKHRDNCLCYSCDKMKPGEPDHCPIASRLYAVCKEFSLVTPVYECPEFSERV
jgi:hypothetical protein